MNYVGLFEGISGFGLAFKRAGANILTVCEIDKTCQSVLRRHHPNAEIISDVKTITKDSFNGLSVSILAGGFPCQDLSVAGQRKGLAGERSGLWFEFIRIIGDHKPRWVVIENVSGLLSSNGGRDFAVILRGLAECGYFVAYRVLDSQYDGVAQRRNRVFLVASLGTASCVEILFERDGSQWASPPRREAGERVADSFTVGASQTCGFPGDVVEQSFGLIGNGEYAERPATLRAKGGDCGGGSEHLIAFGGNNTSGPIDVATACNAHGGTGRLDFESETFLVAPTLRSNGDAHSGFTAGDGLIVGSREVAQCLTANYGKQPDNSGTALGPNLAINQFGVRRLTPTECERLQGFPDGWTAFGHDDKPISDSARYRMLGNAVCVPTAEWIARRILRAEAQG